MPGNSEPALPLAGLVWSSSELVAHLMVDHDIEDKRILDLGCGMGLVSHLLNLRGADISSMDIDPIAGEYLRKNAKLNRCPKIRFYNASWGDTSPGIGEFDLILGSDILYEPRHIIHLAAFLDRHINESGEVIVADPDRGQTVQFRAMMKALGFSCRETRPLFRDRLGVPYTGKLYYFRRN